MACSFNLSPLLRRVHDHGIGMQVSFIIGYDWDRTATFESVLNNDEKSGLDSVYFTVLTPYTGTEVFSRMMAEKRIIITDRSRYDMAQVLYKPGNMTVDELQEGYLYENRCFCSWSSVIRRLPAFRKSIVVFGPMNWGFRKTWREFSN